MQVLDSLAAFRREFTHCAATIGKYDGMHLGHQAVLRRLQEEARALDVPAVVILSEPQPEEFFAGAAAPVRLCHFWDKVEFLRDFGIDAVFRLQFDETLSQCPAERFIEDVLVDGLGLRCLVVGDDFRFGRNRQGDIPLLRRYGDKAGFRVIAMQAHEHGGERISSTLVRERLKAGDLAGARALLGRDYSISGEVVRGRQLGRKLGVPTANLRIETNRLPFTGIYVARVLVRGQEFEGIASIGYRPTVTDSREPSLEVHIFDFDGDIYGAQLRVAFLHKLRDEEKFADVESMRLQILRDLDAARAWFRAQVTGAAP